MRVRPDIVSPGHYQPMNVKHHCFVSWVSLGCLGSLAHLTEASSMPASP